MYEDQFTVEKWVNEVINKFSIPQAEDEGESYDYTTSMIDHSFVDLNWDDSEGDFIW